MRKVFIMDRTLCFCPGASFRQKLETAARLDQMGVAAIEAPPLPEDETGMVLMRSLCGTTENAVLALETDLTERGAERAWDAIRTAKKPRLIVAAPATCARMEYVCHQKPANMLDLVARTIARAKALSGDVEFRCEDATRADAGYLLDMLRRAAAAGATRLTLCDTAGLKTPGETAALIAAVREALPGMPLDILCADEIGMARAGAYAALIAGAEGVKTSLRGALPPPDDIGRILRARGGDDQMDSDLDNTRAKRLSAEIAELLSATHGASPFDAPVGGAAPDAALTGDYDDAALFRACRDLGYSLGEDDLRHVREALESETHGKGAGRRELEAIILSVAQQVPRTYKLVNFVINSGSTIAPTAAVELEKDGEVMRGLCTGDGPIDAAFLAVEQIVGRHYEMDDFQIAAVTQNRAAMGDALVRLRHKGKIYAGKGISTDIIGAAIRAYVSALNKIAYEEKQE